MALSAFLRAARVAGNRGAEAQHSRPNGSNRSGEVQSHAPEECLLQIIGKGEAEARKAPSPLKQDSRTPLGQPGARDKPNLCIAQQANSGAATDPISLLEKKYDAAVEQYHLAAAEFIRGNPEPYKIVWSHRDDVTLGNPFGPFVRGWQQVAPTLERAASLYREGEFTDRDLIAKHVSRELAYIVVVDRLKTKMGGSAESTPVALRATSVFRLEDNAWKLVHRHADPITAARPVETVIQK